MTPKYSTSTSQVHREHSGAVRSREHNRCATTSTLTARAVVTVKEKFAWHRIVGRCGLFTPAMIVALGGFFDRYNLESGCWPSHETIATEYGISIRTSKAAVHIARESGLIRSKPRYHDTHIWTLTIPEHLEHLAALKVVRSGSAAHCTPTESESAAHRTLASNDDGDIESQSAAHRTLIVEVQNEAESTCSPLPPNSEPNTLYGEIAKLSPPKEIVDRDRGDTMFEELCSRYPQDHLGDIEDARAAFALARDTVNDDGYLLAQVDNVAWRVYNGANVPLLREWLRSLRPFEPRHVCDADETM